MDLWERLMYTISRAVLGMFSSFYWLYWEAFYGHRLRGASAG